VRNLFITLLVRDPLTSTKAGADLLRQISEFLPRFYPRRYGQYEPPNNPFDPAHLADAWLDPFIWDGETSAGGMVAMRRYAGDQHGLISMSSEPAEAEQHDALAFLSASASRFDADFGFVHLLNPAEIELAAPGTAGFVRPNVPAMPIASQDIQEHIPDLYWATVLGPALVDAVRDEVSGMPVERVDVLEGGHVLIQLTASLHDPTENFDVFRDVRTAAKEHVTPGFFYSSNT
jgi:hypothetical protein